VFAACAILVGSVQLVYWETYAGKLVYWSYGPDERFTFFKLNIWNCFFSYRKGWFVYTPFMIISLMGFIPLYKYKRQVFWPLLLFTLLNLWVFTAWHCWWYGGSFSQRAVVQSYAILFFPVSSFLAFAFKRRATTIATILFTGFCIWMNLVMTYQANSPTGGMDSDTMNKKYFWKIFGKPIVDDNDRKFIETHDEVPANKESSLKTIFTSDLENDSLAIDTGISLSGKKSYLLDTEHNFVPEVIVPVSNSLKGWYRFRPMVYMQEWENDYWKQATIYISITNKGEVIRRQAYHLTRIAKFRQWSNLYIDIETPENGQFDEIRAGLCNGGGSQKVYLDNPIIQFATK
jgi:hypothetical protein